jgi:hypothetical protein
VTASIEDMSLDQVINTLTTIGDTVDFEMTNKDLTKALLKLTPVILAFEARILALEKKLIKDTPN